MTELTSKAQRLLKTRAGVKTDEFRDFRNECMEFVYTHCVFCSLLDPDDYGEIAIEIGRNLLPLLKKFDSGCASFETYLMGVIRSHAKTYSRKRNLRRTRDFISDYHFCTENSGKISEEEYLDRIFPEDAENDDTALAPFFRLLYVCIGDKVWERCLLELIVSVIPFLDQSSRSSVCRIMELDEYEMRPLFRKLDRIADSRTGALNTEQSRLSQSFARLLNYEFKIIDPQVQENAKGKLIEKRRNTLRLLNNKNRKISQYRRCLSQGTIAVLFGFPTDLVSSDLFRARTILAYCLDSEDERRIYLPVKIRRKADLFKPGMYIKIDGPKIASVLRNLNYDICIGETRK